MKKSKYVVIGVVMVLATIAIVSACASRKEIDVENEAGIIKEDYSKRNKVRQDVIDEINKEKSSSSINKLVI
ncbi:hypothetical protein [Clostridium sp.]|uniref:hypothetical protein n=1 Tax=Clostridium sp. TaxID=1506 RepID=UPI0026DD028D|nr:hypothetical protein [Clostridium sp.]MDO5039620.1 hypothetical protein [Clostridium sp.]